MVCLFLQSKKKFLFFLLRWTCIRGPGPASGCTALHQSLGIFSLPFSRNISCVNVQSFVPEITVFVVLAPSTVHTCVVQVLKNV